MIEVVGGLIIKSNRVLLTQRLPEKDYAFAWECPGGKREGDEDEHATLRRELREEIGIEAGLLPPEPLFRYAFNRKLDGKRVCWMLYLVPGYMGRPKPCEGQGLGWFTGAEMRSLPLTPGNAAAATLISAWVRL